MRPEDAEKVSVMFPLLMTKKVKGKAKR